MNRIPKRVTKKFEEIELYCRGLLRHADDELENFEDSVAKRFGGESFNTGGNCMVVYIPINDNSFIGVSTDCIVLYKRVGRKSVKRTIDCYHNAWDGQGENELRVEYF